MQIAIVKVLVTARFKLLFIVPKGYIEKPGRDKRLVLCQEKVQVKSGKISFSSVVWTNSNLLFSSAFPFFSYNVLHMYLVTDIHNGCEFLLYYRMFLYTQTPIYRHGYNQRF